MQPAKPLVFVSCGQSTEAERGLGKNICALIAVIRPDVEAYFADNQSTVEGLSNNILKALYKAAGFVCVMHRRGDIETPDKRTVTRGSVWVEQEIAVTAFMGHVLGRTIPTYFYKQAGISLEGIRSVLLMNPRMEFVDDSQVLEDLKLVLPSAVLNPFNEYDIQPIISHRCTTRGNGERHTYVLTADVKNVGKQRITDFLLHLYFPRAFLNSSTTWGAEDKQYSTSSHICFAANQERAPGGLYPGQTMRNSLSVEYFVDNGLFRNAAAMRSQIIVEVFSGSVHKKLELDIRDYQEF
ncbi:MAG TPA: hypothetical protein VMI94_29100 [Bryobacteraceae bacterium]|nr:hypothetical protein [Bryobacteraceae bacterium]